MLCRSVIFRYMCVEHRLNNTSSYYQHFLLSYVSTKKNSKFYDIMHNAYREDFFLWIHENTGRLNSYSKQKTRIEQSYHDYKVNEKEAAHIYKCTSVQKINCLLISLSLRFFQQRGTSCRITMIMYTAQTYHNYIVQWCQTYMSFMVE